MAHRWHRIAVVRFLVTQRNFENIGLMQLFLLLLLSNSSISDANDRVNETNNNFDLAQIIRSIALIYTDDKLDPEVEEYINHQPEIIWEDNAYVYLWGMNVKTDNPYETGKEILEKLLEEDKLYEYEQHPLELGFLNDYPLYQTPENDLLCKKHEKECIEKILKNKKNVDLLLSGYGFYKSRYITFLSFHHFSQIADTRMESAIPSFSTISIAQKIYHISLLQKLDNITNPLLNELNQLKNLLKQADTLIAKMIVLSLIDENIELFNYLYQKGISNLNTETNQSKFKPLSSSEMSLYKAMYEEHSKWMKMLFDWTSDINRLVKPKKNRTPFTQGIIRLLYFFSSKPNLTVNTQYNGIVKHLLRITKLPPKLFYQEYLLFNNNVQQDQIRNYTGHMLMSYSNGDYLVYQARVFDIDMKLQLMRLIIHSESIDNLKINNNYLSSYDQTIPFKEKDKWCYSGIAKMFPEFRCLNIY